MTCLAYVGLLARAWTHSTYTMKNISEYANIVLELLELDNNNQPLRVLTSMFISIPIEGSCEMVVRKKKAICILVL